MVFAEPGGSGGTVVVRRLASGGEVTAGVIEGNELVLYVNPELQRLRALVDAARARLAELEAGCTTEKAGVEGMKARLFAGVREHFQRRRRWLPWRHVPRVS